VEAEEVEAVEADEAQVEDEEMGGSERQGDEQHEQDESEEADRGDESEVAGRLASVSAGVGARARKRKSGESGSVESVESIGKRQRRCKPVDEFDEAIAKAMESGDAGLDENADEDTRIAFFLKGAETINGPRGLAEQIQAKAKAGEAGGSRQLSLSCDALSMELQELEEKRGNLREAMQKVTRCLDALTYATRLKRQRS
jgi:hypothetical protein